MRILLAVLLVSVSTSPAAGAADGPAENPKPKPVDVPLSNPGGKFRIVGMLGVPFGEVVKVQGVVVEGPLLGFEGGPNLLVQRINGKATQKHIQIKLENARFEKKDKIERELPRVEPSKTYEFEGYETGGFAGIPYEVQQRWAMGLQTTDHYFRHELNVRTVKAIDAIVWSPADFVGREALLDGKAVSRNNKAYIDGSGWKLLTDRIAAWPKEFEGKTVEGLGTMMKADGGEFKLEKGVTRLVKLGDQKGRAVALRGTAWSMNGHWWLEYRGTELYVDGMKYLPGWNVYLHAAPVLISGVLDEAMLPDLSQITLKSCPNLKKYFIVRKPSWKPLDALLAPERVERK
jgi:hypothetical protein